MAEAEAAFMEREIASLKKKFEVEKSKLYAQFVAERGAERILENIIEPLRDSYDCVIIDACLWEGVRQDLEVRKYAKYGSRKLTTVLRHGNILISENA